MKEVNINISSVGFPSQFVSDAEKATDEFLFSEEENADWTRLPPVTEVEAGPSNAKDWAQPLNNNNDVKRTNNFLILPFCNFSMFKHRFVVY